MNQQIKIYCLCVLLWFVMSGHLTSERSLHFLSVSTFDIRHSTDDYDDDAGLDPCMGLWYCTTDFFIGEGG